MATVLELKEQRSQLWERMKALVDGAEAESRDLTPEEETNWGQANRDIDAMEKRIARQSQLERTPATEPEAHRAAAVDVARMPAHELRATPEYAKAFNSWLRTPRQVDLDADSRSIIRGGFVDSRAMGTNVATAGGYLVPDTFVRSMEEALLAYGGMRSVATVISTSDGGDLQFPISNDTTNVGEILAENTQASEQDATVGMKVFKAFMYSSKIVRVSYQFLQDGAIDVEGWLSRIMGERIARITNTHFTTGVGANMPSGIEGDATSGVAGATGQTVTVKADDLISLEHSVGVAYRRQNARYMFADATLQAIRKLKDGEGNYLWAPSQPSGGFPSTINGYPYVINDDVAAMAASAKSIFFGALAKYIIRDVRGFALMRLEERYADYLQVGFLGFSRHDGGLIDAGTHPVTYFQNSAT